MAALVIWLAGTLLPGLHVLGTVGLILLLIAGVAYFLRPRTRTMYWRERKIDLGDEPGVGSRIYRTLFKH